MIACSGCGTPGEISDTCAWCGTRGRRTVPARDCSRCGAAVPAREVGANTPITTQCARCVRERRSASIAEGHRKRLRRRNRQSSGEGQRQVLAWLEERRPEWARDPRPGPDAWRKVGDTMDSAVGAP